MNTIAENTPDTTSHAGYAMHHVPTRMQRLRRWLGFRYHLGEEPEGTEKLTGWMCTEVRLNFGWTDRLRLLSTGRLEIKVFQHTNVQVDQSVNRIDWQIRAPGER